MMMMMSPTHNNKTIKTIYTSGGGFAVVGVATDRGVWIVVDGMVLDVKRWLPEHPGGDRIIPAQSLNAEAARHFELYHSSKESFLYLKHFYIGEVRRVDRETPGVVPAVPGPPASADFLQQLREYTDFRLRDDGDGDGEEVSAHVLHLGVRR